MVKVRLDGILEDLFGFSKIKTEEDFDNLIKTIEEADFEFIDFRKLANVKPDSSKK